MANPSIRVGKYFIKVLDKYKSELKDTPFDNSSTPTITDLWAKEYLDYKCGVKRVKKKRK